MTETGRQNGLTPSRTLLRVAKIPCPAHVAERLGITVGSPVIVRSRVMSADGVPVRISNSYFPPTVAAAETLLQSEFIQGGLQSLFETSGTRFGRAEESLIARMPTGEEAAMLDLEPSIPVVQLLRTSYDEKGSPVHTLESICAADRHVFTVTQMEGDRTF